MDGDAERKVRVREVKRGGQGRADYRNIVEEPWAGTGGLSALRRRPPPPADPVPRPDYQNMDFLILFLLYLLVMLYFLTVKQNGEAIHP